MRFAHWPVVGLCSAAALLVLAGGTCQVPNPGVGTKTATTVGHPPVAVAGADVNVKRGSVAQLDGRGSYDLDGNSDITIYEWAQTSGSPKVLLTNAGTAVASFTAPDVSQDTELVFQLYVQDSTGKISTDDVRITVKLNGGQQTQYSLSVTIEGQGSVNPTGGAYDEGASVTLAPTPASGWQFSGWSGDLTGSANPATLTMSGNKSVTATFTQLPPSQYTLTVSIQGQGTVGLNPSGGTYASGTEVTLTPSAASGWQFSGWSGDLSGSANPATLTMSGNKSVTATFTQLPASIQWDVGPTVIATGADLQLAFNATRVGGRDEHNTLHLVWQDGSQVFHGRLVQGATSWTVQPLPPMTSSVQASKPTLAILPGLMIAAWTEFSAGQRSVVVSRSQNAGQSWESPFVIARGNFADPITLYAFARSNGSPGAIIGWDDLSTPKSMASAWNGQSWSAANWTSPASLSSGTSGDSQNICISGYGEKLLAAWKDSRSGQFQVYLADSSDGGLNWSADRLIPVPSQSAASGLDPDVAFADASHVYITWHNQTRMYLTYSNDGAQSFGEPKALGPGLFGHVVARGPIIADAWEHTTVSFVDDSTKTVGLAVSLDNLATIDTPHALPGSESLFSVRNAAVLLSDQFIDVVWVNVSDPNNTVLQCRTGQLP